MGSKTGTDLFTGQVESSFRGAVPPVNGSVLIRPLLRELESLVAYEKGTGPFVGRLRRPEFP